MEALRLGTRRSALAGRQTQEAADALAALGVATQAVICRTQGDLDRTTPLPELGGQGVFARAIEQALVDGGIDVAVHSAKDLELDLLDGTQLVAFLPRADVRDVLVSRDALTLERLPAGARLGTSSRRRAGQVRAWRSDLQVVDIRGNVDTRLAKVARADYDATILAAAGLARLGRLDAVAEYLSIDRVLPAPGQGAIALQARRADARTVSLLRRINHEPTAVAVRTERACLRALGAGCSLPVAALAHVRGTAVTVAGIVVDEHDGRLIRAQRSGDAADPEAAGAALGEALLSQGAGALIREAVS